MNSTSTESSRPEPSPLFDVQGPPIPVGNPQASPPELLIVDKAYYKRGQLFVEGWCTGDLEFGLEADGEPLKPRRLSVTRPDVASNLNLPATAKIGFVLVADCEDEEAAVTLVWKDALGKESRSHTLTYTAPPRGDRGGLGQDDDDFFDDRSRPKRSAGGKKKTPRRDPARRLRLADQEEGISCSIDHALLLEDGCLLLDGWAAAAGTEDDPLTLELLLTGLPPVECELIRFERSDVKQQIPWLQGERLGFITIVKLLDDVRGALRLRYTAGDGMPQSIPLNPTVAGHAELAQLIEAHWRVNTAIMARVRETFTEVGDEDVATAFEWARRKVFFAIHGKIGTAVDNLKSSAFAIDHAIPLGPDGILLYGWRHFVQGKVKAVRAHGSDGEVCDITGAFFPRPRADVAKSLAPRYPDITEFCGFICHIPLPTKAGDCRLLEIELGDDSSQWLRIALPGEQLKGLSLIKNVLERVEASDSMRATLFTLLDKHLGEAIQSINASRPAFSGQIVEQQFGKPPENPKVSIVVPLYGRYDFVRYQLSHFADDPDFRDIDLIYVIDDPAIAARTNELATVYQPVFDLPFRTLSYGTNLGFAGANNIGVRAARGEVVVLCNSDVLPKQPGWVGLLRQALDTLPGAGAVAPLLQFADDSVQHAGMVPQRKTYLPGFLLNVHPGKGQPWEGPDEPQEFPLLTAACLMLRRQDYLALGGLDEGYIIGDFEDSDLCLALRKAGKGLWLVPEAKLWHLERQSQNLESIAGYRHMLTLYNAWRFQKKIRDGLIADPVEFTPSQA